jgi:hypothetical protein
MTERRFHDDEVAAIFERAAQHQPTEAPARLDAGGITLAQLLEIARDVGIAPDAITQAVATLDQRGTATSRRWMGIPVGVGRTVELPRNLTDDEWERLVADLRETFDARGVVRSEGSMREWSNGNLHVLLERTTAGHRLRFRTEKGTARPVIGLAIGIIAYVAVGIFIETTRSGPIDPNGVRAIILAGVGLSGIGVWLAQLPRWARLRGDQMEAVAARVAAQLQGNNAGDARDSDSA